MKKIIGLLFAAAIVLVAVSCSVSTSGSRKPAAPPTVTEDPVDPSTTTEEAPPPAVPATPSGLSDGTYLVGTDIKSGKYKTAGPGSTDTLDACYWSVNKDDLGLDIVSNDNITGPARLSVKAGQYLELSGGCNWSRVIAP